MSFKQKLVNNVPAQYSTDCLSKAVLRKRYDLMNVTGANSIKTTNQGRYGDEVWLDALHINFNFHNDPVINAPVFFRYMIFFSGEEYTPERSLNQTVSASNPITELFLPANTTATNAQIRWDVQFTNPKSMQKLYDGHFTVHNQVTDGIESKTASISVPLKQTFKYQKITGEYGKTKNLYICMWYDDFTAAAEGLVVGQMEMAYNLVFKSV